MAKHWADKLIELIERKEKKDMVCRKKVWQGVRKWVAMMVEEGEIELYKDEIADNGETIYGWQGENEVVASIASYIFMKQ